MGIKGYVEKQIKLVTKGVKSRVGELSEVTNHVEPGVQALDLPYASCVTSAMTSFYGPHFSSVKRDNFSNYLLGFF